MREGVVRSVWCHVLCSEGIYHWGTNAKITQDLKCASPVYHHSFMKCNKFCSIQAILELKKKNTLDAIKSDHSTLTTILQL